ncbi:50S ribosomal protein L6 [Rhodothermus marinus]|jgi:large subunit ribosomal protein L6|uniref:Large ribosomal subunit protein uL6 n=1 Tax=Rhodothermus marinus (strain ATCC 43812 / DSM 4252 / R-10) TaxID=518766 RepID=D0MGW9_RHOM4|nr:50S ribosomal protein L6 [Rhodothermus marinus]ACY47754.1 ribosomal protein L6 [Rhodothermus marinus DSM 4252]MBO2492480.1 50S ribosomal protein L6 [Rhodothermus marinus]
MSRIGRLPIHLPDGVRVEVAPNNVVTVTGPKGTLTLQVDPDITVEVADKTVRVLRPTEQKRHRAMHGLYRALIQNMVTGVTEGYRKELEIIGIGFRASMSGNMLELALGYSHPIYFVPPEGIKLSVRSERGSNPIVIVEGIDKQLVGEVAAKIRALRPPEPYKGKGIRYVGEYVRRKAGKTAGR